MIDTTDGLQSRQPQTMAVTTGRSYQMDKRTPSMKTTTISSTTEVPATPTAGVESAPVNLPFGSGPIRAAAEEPIAAVTPAPVPEVGPVKTVFKKSAVANADIYDLKPKPYQINTNKEELEFKCELCLEMPCCPEHCCDVSYSFAP